MEIVLLLFLIICAFLDIKEKQLPALFLVGVFMILVLLEIFLYQRSVSELVLDGILGGIFLVIGVVSKQAVGYADGFVLCCSGLVLGFYRNLNLLFYSLIAISLFSIIMLIIRKLTVKDRIPFLPFVLAGYLGVLFV